MNKRDKTRITLKIKQMAKDVKEFLSSDENQVYPAYHSDFFLVSSFDDEREEILVNLLNDQTYAAKFSEEYLEKLLKEKVTTLMQSLRQRELSGVRPQKLAGETAEAIFSELDSYTTKLTIYLPVTGLNIQPEEGKFEIGNITFQNMTQERIDEIIGHLSSTIKVLKYSDEEKQHLITFYTKEIKQRFQEKENQVYAIYHIVAEPIQAEKRAKEACYEVFDLLRYALPRISTLYPMGFSIPMGYIDKSIGETNKYAQRDKQIQAVTDKYVSFGLQGEIGTHTESISNIIILRDTPGFNWKISRKERPYSLPINAPIIEVLEKDKVFEASKILKKDKVSRTDFERCILRSIHWFANAQTPMQPEYVLLSLMSSIETFLNPPGGHGDVTTAIVNGVAALGGTQGYNYAKKRMNELYDKRSALSHGDHRVIFERDISELRAIAFYLIHQMLQSTDEFTTQEQLYKDVEKIREEIKQENSASSPQEE